MRLSELQEKDIINLNDGRKLGKIIDVTVDNGKIYNFIIEPKRTFFSFIRKNEEISVCWDDISKIGTDVILINSNN